MKDTQTISDWTTSFASVVKADHNSNSTEASNEVIGQVRAELAKADERIATLESELGKRQATIKRLLSDDLLSSEEVTELKELVWQFHRGLPGGCTCYVCLEVEQSRKELEGLI